MPRSPSKLPTHEFLLECFDYDFETGMLFWKQRPLKHFMHCKFPDRVRASFNGNFASKEAFTAVDCGGYKRGELAGKRYLSHRVIYKLVTGEEPEFVDHIDRNKLNNKIENLRSVCHQENMKNQKMAENNTSGVTGVYKNERYGTWFSSIRNNGKTIYLGVFKNMNDAILAREVAEEEYGYHHNHGRT